MHVFCVYAVLCIGNDGIVHRPRSPTGYTWVYKTEKAARAQQRVVEQLMYIYDVPGGNVTILGGHSEYKYVYMCHIPNACQNRANRVHCTSEQHAISSHESQSTLILTSESSNMYYGR
jgi:hypothetical protein